MKKEATLFLAACALTNVVHAQTSVTLYGLFDEGLDFGTNVSRGTNAKTLRPLAGGNRYALTSGAMQGSRWGLMGKEDLGSGLSAIFRLENGFDGSTGKLAQGGAEFGRQAYVGVASRHIGTLTLGRQYETTGDYSALNFGQQLGGVYATRPGDLDNGSHSVRVNNAIKYTSVDYNGLSFTGLYSLGGIAGAAGRNQIYSMGATYKGSSFTTFVAFLRVSNPNNAFFGDNPSGAGVAGNNMIGASPVYGGYSSANAYEVLSTGAGYVFSSAWVNLIYSHTDFKGLGDTTNSGPNLLGYTGSASFNSFEINGTYQITPAIAIAAAYDYTSGAPVSSRVAGIHASGATYNQIAGAVQYRLSKRTDVYLQSIYQRASGNDSTGGPATAQVGTFTASSNDRQFVTRIGLRHLF